MFEVDRYLRQLATKVRHSPRIAAQAPFSQVDVKTTGSDDPSYYVHDVAGIYDGQISGQKVSRFWEIVVPNIGRMR